MKKLKYYFLTKSIGLGLNSLSYLHSKSATKIAYRLFSEPRKGKLTKENLPEVLRNIPTQRIPANDDHLETYIWKGNDTVILLVHGWESNTSRWEKLLPYLQKTGSTIVAIDAPGHGLSGGTEFNVIIYAAYIDVAVKQFNPSVLIGHSIGGAACIYYQSQYQNTHLKKIVILGAPSDYQLIVSNYVALLSLNKRMNLLLEAAFTLKYNRQISTFSIAAFAKKIQLPGLIIHDTEDQIVAFNEGQKIASSWKNSKFLQTTGLGHSLHSDEVYTNIIAFLNA